MPSLSIAPLWVTSSQGSMLPPDSPVPPKWQTSKPVVDVDIDVVDSPVVVVAAVVDVELSPPLEVVAVASVVASVVELPEVELPLVEVEPEDADSLAVPPSSPAQPPRAIDPSARRERGRTGRREAKE